MAGHAQLKLVTTECSKTQIRLTGLICLVPGVLKVNRIIRHLLPYVLNNAALIFVDPLLDETKSPAVSQITYTDVKKKRLIKNVA